MGMQGPTVHTMDMKECPFIGKKCIGNECSLWMQFAREDGQTWQACSFVLAPILQQANITESARVQASLDKVTNVFVQMLTLARHRSLENEQSKELSNGGT